MPEVALRRVPLRGRNCVLSECARCGRTRPLWARGMCSPCNLVTHRDGTYTGYERARDGRLADYAERRATGDSIAEAAKRTGVSTRTGERYEAELRLAVDEAGSEQVLTRTRSSRRPHHPSSPRPVTVRRGDGQE